MTLKEFKSLYKKIERVKGSDEQKNLWESICYLLEKEPQNQKTLNAIEMVLIHYVKKEKVQELDYDDVVNRLIINLFDVPKSVADAINKRAAELKIIDKNIEEQRNKKIIDLLKIEDNELSK